MEEKNKNLFIRFFRLKREFKKTFFICLDGNLVEGYFRGFILFVNEMFLFSSKKLLKFKR